MWWKAGNVSILVKLTFVDMPYTSREPRDGYGAASKRKRRVFFGRDCTRGSYPTAKPYSVILRVPRGESRVISSVRDTLCLIDS